MPMLLGLTGPAGCGKDSVANHLQREHAFTPTSFAAPLKNACQYLFGLSHDEVTDRELKEKTIPFWGLSPRQIMQRFGTEAMKVTFGDEFWVKSWLRTYQKFGTTDHVVVSDVRFEEEAAQIRAMGGRIVHITRNNNPLALDGDAAKHASEMGVARLEGDLVIGNNGALNDLYIAADTVARIAMGV